MPGLSDYKKRTAKSPGWFSLKLEETKRIYIPVELADMPRFVDHSSPHDFKTHAVCTYPKCYPCEQGTAEWKGKVKIAIPIVEDGVLKVLSQGNGKGSLWNSLVETFREENSVIGWYDVTKTGKGRRTKYTAIPVKNDDERLDKSAGVAYNKNIDYSRHVLEVEYEKQYNYYTE